MRATRSGGLRSRSREIAVTPRSWSCFAPRVQRTRSPGVQFRHGLGSDRGARPGPACALSTPVRDALWRLAPGGLRAARARGDAVAARDADRELRGPDRDLRDAGGPPAAGPVP